VRAGRERGFRSQRKSDIFSQNRGLTPFDATMQDNPQALPPKPQLPVVPLPGSRPLSNARHEHYCRLRSLLCPKGQALREAGMRAVKNHDAVSNATRLERRQDVRDRIAFLVRQEEEVLAEKRKRIEETLWAIHEADIGDYFETHEIEGKTIERPKRLADLPTEIRKNIEKITIDGRGRSVPQLYSKLAASQELRKMLNFGRLDERSDVSRLSDAELIAQLSDTAKELGIEINLNYSFAQPQEPEGVDCPKRSGPPEILEPQRR
jgi:Terminase small subunit